MGEVNTKHYEYNVHNELMHEYETGPAAPETPYNGKSFVSERGRRVFIEQQSGIKYHLLPHPTSNLMLAEEIHEADGDRVLWPLHDHQGTVTAAFSENWSSAGDYQVFEFDGFGQPNEILAGMAALLNQLHAGRDFDEYTNLYYNNARWYDPTTGKFISVDPIGFAGGDTNLYRYVFNSPANGTDPSGNEFLTAAAIGIGTVIGGIGLAMTYYGVHEAEQAVGGDGGTTLDSGLYDAARYARGQGYVQSGLVVSAIGGSVIAAP